MNRIAISVINISIFVYIYYEIDHWFERILFQNSSLSADFSILMSPHLKAGAAVLEITPTGSVFLYGYPNVPRQSTGVHDPLQCAALHLASGDRGVLFLANDLISIPNWLVGVVRRRLREATGVVEEAILISATHTHSGPVTADHLGNADDPFVPKADPAYLNQLGHLMVEAGVRAVKASVAAELGVGSARVEGVGGNRHDPRGPADPEVTLLLARDAATHIPIACMTVYGMHPTVLHEDSLLISADFPHFTRDYLRRHALPPSCPVLYHTGVAGNQSPRHFTQGNTFAEARRLGEILGRTIAAALPDLTFQRDVALRFHRQEVLLQPRHFPSLEEALRALASRRDRFAHLKATGATRQELRTAECDVFGAEKTAKLARAVQEGRLAQAVRACQPAEIQIIEVGPQRFVAWPGEFFVEYGLEVKQQAPGTAIITLANGGLQGYVVTPEAAERGLYEATNALFGHENGRRFVDETLRLLNVAAS